MWSGTSGLPGWKEQIRFDLKCDNYDNVIKYCDLTCTTITMYSQQPTRTDLGQTMDWGPYEARSLCLESGLTNFNKSESFCNEHK